MVDRTLQIVRLTTNFHEHFIQVPAPLCHLAQMLIPPSADHLSEVRSKPVHPKPNTFVTNVDAPLMQEVLALRNDSGSRTYIMTASWIISGDVLK